MWVKQDGVIHRNQIGQLENDLDKLPFPEKQLWCEYGCFRDNLEVFTGRGCPFKCTFCNIHYQREIFEGKGDFLRKRSVENVMEELKQNLAHYDPKLRLGARRQLHDQRAVGRGVLRGLPQGSRTCPGTASATRRRSSPRC